MLDFPGPPLTVGQVFQNWKWDGVAWIAAGSEAMLPLTGGTMTGVINFAAGQTIDGYLPLTGGTLTPPNNQLGLDINNTGTGTGLTIRNAGLTYFTVGSGGLVQIGTPTGTAVTGAGNINIAGGYYVNGVSIGTGPFLPLTGGTLTGNLTISRTAGANPALLLNRTTNDQICYVDGRLNDVTRWRLIFGDSAVEGTGNVGSNFTVTRYDNAGASLGNVLTLRRSDGMAIMTRATVNGLFIISPTAANVDARLTKPVGDYQNLINGTTAGELRWSIALGDNAPESGGNTGSEFAIVRRDDDGESLGTPFFIRRSDGMIFIETGFNSNLTISRTNPSVILNKDASGYQNRIDGRTNTVLRWRMQIGDGEAESTGNAGSNLSITRYDDAGTLVGTVFSINRATGLVTLANDLTVSGTPRTPSQAWAAVSDERVKQVVSNYAHGLAEIKQLNPIVFRYLGNDADAPGQQSAYHQLAKDKTEFVGLVAQSCERYFPEMVSMCSGFIDNKPVEDLRELNNGPLIYALVNSCKELAARVEALEKRRH